MKIITSLLMMLLPTMVMAQAASKYMSDAELVSLSNDKKTIIIRCSGQAEKKKDAVIMAEKSALYNLLHKGIEGVNNGRPLTDGEDNSYDRRLFFENRYTTFIKNSTDLESYRKVGKETRAQVEVEFYYAAILKDIPQTGKTAPNGLENLPSITVVPFISVGEDQLKVLEGNNLRRSAAATVSSKFSSRGYVTKNYRSLLMNYNNNDILLMGTQSDAITKMLQNSGTDLKVEVNVSCTKGATNIVSAVVEISAVEVFTSNTLASIKISGQARGDSTFVVEQIMQSSSNAQKFNNFFTQLNNQFATNIKEGLEVNVNMGISNNIDDWTFDDEMPNGKVFKEELEEWLQNKAVNGNARIDMNNDKYLGIVIRVPFYNAQGKPYKLSGFRSDLRKYLKTLLGDSYSAKIEAEGQKLTVKIQ